MGVKFKSERKGRDVAKRSRSIRFKRPPGTYRIHERKLPDPRQELQRIILYLSAGVLDQAELQAIRKGFDTVQGYCETLLRNAIEAECDREREERAETKRGALEDLNAIAEDPEYLAELSASAARRPLENRPTAIEQGDWELLRPESQSRPSDSALIVLRHAASGLDDPTAFLPTLRRSEPLSSDSAQELLRALTELEVETREAARIDRKLAYALHRLAFEGQILLTDSWQNAAVDESTVDILRIVQESVDRILSGEDIRYYARNPSGGIDP